VSGEVRRIRRRFDSALMALAALVDELDNDERVRVNAIPALHRAIVAEPDGIKPTLLTIEGDLARRVNEIACAHGDENHQFTIPRLGTVEATWTGKRTVWSNHGQILHRIASRAADLALYDPTTGERRDEPMPPGALAMLVAEEVADCAGLLNASATWRAKQLKARGIDPDAYTDRVGESRPTAKWVG
jgi:hypothetical protein